MNNESIALPGFRSLAEVRALAPMAGAGVPAMPAPGIEPGRHVHPRRRALVPRAALAIFCTLAALAAGTLRTHGELIFGVTDTGALVLFDSATPGTLQGAGNVTGLQPGEILVGIDFRPATGQLYGLGSSNRLYTINTNTGVATLVGTLPSPLNGTTFGMDFNPTVDRIRVVSDADQNLRLNPVTGALAATDANLAYAAGDPNAAANPGVSAIAYANNTHGATATTLFGLDSDLNTLVSINPPNNGTLNTLGPLGADITAINGFDISGSSGVAYAALTVGGVSGLYTINLATGAATFVGAIGPAGTSIRALTVVLPPVPGELIYGINAAGALVMFNSVAPQILLTSVAITGLQPGEAFRGIDFRPSTGQLFGLGSSSALYTVNTNTGVATLVSALSPALNGTAFGVDFNPTVDRLRVVSDAGQNLRINPTNGAVTVDTALNPGTPTVTATAYANNTNGATTTTLFAIDVGADVLVTINPPNNGTLNIVGSLGVNADSVNGFDISGRSGKAYAGLSVGGISRLYTINLQTGAATLVGNIGSGAPLILGLTAVPARPVPPNDHFTNATLISGATGISTGYNEGATAESGEPVNSSRTVWWRWTAPASGCTWFTTARSSFDTLLCVFTGAAVNSLTQVGCNDDAPGEGLQSRVEFNAVPGTEYWIRVDGFNGNVGEIVLRWGGTPANDNFASATVIPGASGTATGSNRCSTQETNEPALSGGGGRTIWYCWTAPGSGPSRYFFSTRGSSFDTILCVFTGAAVNSLASIGCNDDFAGLGVQSRVEFNVTPGTIYWIRVDGFGSPPALPAEAGDIMLDWGVVLTAPVINCSTNVVAECAGGLTPVTFSVTASNAFGPLPVTCVPPSGTGFRLGTSNVVCTANTTNGSATCSFTVTVRDTTPPRVTCPGDIVVRAASPAGSSVTFIASATDPCGIGSLSCTPLPGSTFPIGMTTVTCRATDGVGNSNSCSFTVTVQSPNRCPVATSLSFSVQSGASTNFHLTASDADGEPLRYIITQPPLHGILVVNIQSGASSYSPNQGYCGPDSFKFKVNDGTCDSAEATVTIAVVCPPVIHCSTNLVAECTGGLTPVSFNVTASNALGPVPVTCVPPSGTGFLLGTSNVVCTARNSTVSCRFTVTVVDTTPPTVDCSTNLTLEATNPAGAVAVYSASAVDPCGLASLDCSPSPGSIFPVGTNTVTCTASDPSGNTNSCSFQVVIRGPRAIKEDVLSRMIALRATVADVHDGKELEDAIKKLTESLAPELWIDQLHLERKHGEKAIEAEEKTVHELCELIQDHHSAIPDAILQGFIDDITAADRLLVVTAIQQAVAAGHAPKKIAEANKELAKGDEETTDNKCDNVLGHYEKAWKLAVRAKVVAGVRIVNGHMEVEILGTQGESYTVESSANLLDWTIRGTVKASDDGAATFTDPAPASGLLRFYRVASPE